MSDLSSRDEADLVASLVAHAREKALRLATAESCSGGRIAHLLTLLPGVSDVYMGGVIAYSNQAKHDLLGVEQSLLDQFGAVSAPVAEAMASGASRRLGADFAVSTTGIAGPGGATAAKPVGLVYIAVAWEAGTHVQEFRFSGSRAEIIEQTAHEALQMLSYWLSTFAR